MNFLEIFAYIGLGGIIVTLSGYNYVMWCVKKSEKHIREYIDMCDSETEKEAIRGFLEENLNKLK